MTALVPIPVKPDFDAALEAIKRLVLDSLTSPASKDSYRIAIEGFVRFLREEWRGPLNKAALQAWKSHLQAAGKSAATVNARLAAAKKLAVEMADNGLLLQETASAITRVKGQRRSGPRTGFWLSHEQARALLAVPSATTLVGLRDRALLATLLSCGLRREEACTLTFEHIQQRENRWCIVDLVGKGKKLRTVAMPEWVKLSIDRWAEAAGIEKAGPVFRVAYQASGGTARRLTGRPLTPQAVWVAVRRHAATLGITTSRFLYPTKSTMTRRACRKLSRTSGDRRTC